MEFKNIIEHVEHYLGHMGDFNWKAPVESKHEISISRFSNQPARDLNTFVTFGLSHHSLNMNQDYKEVRQELFFVENGKESDIKIAKLLLRIADLIWLKHEALLRGQVIGPGKRLFTKSDMNALYVTMLVIIEDDQFYTFKCSDPPTIIAWIVPIYSSEAIYTIENGWEAFEELLEDRNPELWDLNRDPVI